MCNVVTEKTIRSPKSLIGKQWEVGLGEPGDARCTQALLCSPRQASVWFLMLFVPEAESPGSPCSWRTQPCLLWAAFRMMRLWVRKLGEGLSFVHTARPLCEACDTFRNLWII